VESNKNIWYIGLGIAAVAVILFMLLPTSVLRPVLYTVLSLGSVFIILLVLIQRGRGGGLAGALGGMGGYSAFGTRAGDIFTRVTIVAAAIWLLAAMALAKMNLGTSKIYENQGPVAPLSSQTPGTGIGDGGKETDDSSSKDTSPAPSEGTQPIDKKTGTETDSRSQ
jgi:preprotein translocase subunit SecG